jgi:hypothetical protein
MQPLDERLMLIIIAGASRGGFSAALERDQ